MSPKSRFRSRVRSWSGLDSLEDRRLLCQLHTDPTIMAARAVSLFSAQVNFQPTSAATPSGYLADTGQAFGPRGALSYGWDADNRSGTRDRNSSRAPDQRHDTLNHMQRGGNRRWEIAVPNGQYDVRVVAGDADFFDGHFRINIEGSRAIDFRPTTAARFADRTITVNVTDGRLTISNGAGASNNKINFVEITQKQIAPNGPTWLTAPGMPLPLAEVASAFVGSKMYVIGSGSNATLAYDLLTNQWSSATALAQRPFYGDHHGMEVIGEKIYVVGGLLSAAGRLQIYDTATDTWSIGANLPWDGGSVSTALINGKIYAAGGVIGSNANSYQGTGATTRSAVYDPITDAWTDLPDMPLARHHTAAATDGARFYLFGGREGRNTLANGFSDVLVFDPSTNQWSSSRDAGSVLRAMPIARSGMGRAVFARDEFYIMGGETLNGAGAINQVYKRVDIYNPKTNTWRRGLDLPTQRHGIFPTLLGNRIYIAGGGDRVGVSASNIFEILDLGQ